MSCQQKKIILEIPLWFFGFFILFSHIFDIFLRKEFSEGKKKKKKFNRHISEMKAQLKHKKNIKKTKKRSDRKRIFIFAVFFLQGVAGWPKDGEEWQHNTRQSVRFKMNNPSKTWAESGKTIRNRNLFVNINWWNVFVPSIDSSSPWKLRFLLLAEKNKKFIEATKVFSHFQPRTVQLLGFFFC